MSSSANTFNYRYFKTCMRLVFDPRNRGSYAIDETLKQARLLVAWLEQERSKLSPEGDDVGTERRPLCSMHRHHGVDPGGVQNRQG